MNVNISPGKYVVAVSGGVDSVVLLALLHGRPGVRLTVAHFDHGIRTESADDRQFVQRLAATYKLPFVYDEGRLGPRASEATARDARYGFLRRVRTAANAEAIITAHHQDDLLETAVLNLLRGTGRKGLSSLQSTVDIRRPLLGVPKQTILEYANANSLEWHEDTTNADDTYLRNYVRHKLLPRFDEQARQKLLQIIDKMAVSNSEIDNSLINQLHIQPGSHELDRRWLIMLPHAVTKEVLAAWLRVRGIRTFDRKTLERIVVAAKTYEPGKQIDVDGTYVINVEKRRLALVLRERWAK